MARIWVIEDEDIVAQLVVELLKSQHYSVERYNGGDKALQALRSNPLPDLIILDLKMPPPDGNYVLQHIAGMGKPPTLILSAYLDYLTPTLRHVPVGCISKPFKMADLLSAVANALQPHTQCPAQPAPPSGGGK